MARPVRGAPTFTEHRYSKSPDLCRLMLMDINNNANFIGGFPGSLRDLQTNLDPGPGGADNLHVSGCTPQLEFESATSSATNERIPISEGLQAASDEGKFQSDNRNGCEKYNDSDKDEWSLGFDEKECVHGTL